MNENRNTAYEAKANFMQEAIVAALPIMQFIKDNQELIYSSCGDEQTKEKVEECLIIFFVMLEKINKKEV